jgi:hypothetical protein
MFEEKQLVAPKKGIAVGALIIAVLCIVLIIAGRIVNMSASRAVYSYEMEAIQHISTGITIAVAFLALLGLILSVVALIKSFRKPEVYGGKAISITALVITGFLSLFSVGAILILLAYLLRK